MVVPCILRVCATAASGVGRVPGRLAAAMPSSPFFGMAVCPAKWRLARPARLPAAAAPAVPRAPGAPDVRRGAMARAGPVGRGVRPWSTGGGGCRAQTVKGDGARREGHLAARSRLQQISEVLKDEPDGPELRYMLAMEYVSGGNDPEAVRCFEELMRRCPEYAPGFHMAARALLRLNRVQETRA